MPRTGTVTATQPRVREPSLGVTGDIQAVRRVAEIMRLFSLDTPSVTVAEAAQKVHLNRTTAHRYFNAMVMAQMLERDPERPGAYMPGPLSLELGTIAHGRRRVLEIAPTYMRKLSEAVDLTVVLSLWAASGPIVSLVAEAQTRSILITVRVGSALSANAAQTRLFLAFLDDEKTARWRAEHLQDKRLPNISRTLKSIRSEGVTRERISEMDGVAIAAPVFGEDEIAATIALIGTTSSLPLHDSSKESKLITTANLLTNELGGSRTQALKLSG